MFPLFAVAAWPRSSCQPFQLKREERSLASGALRKVVRVAADDADATDNATCLFGGVLCIAMAATW